MSNRISVFDPPEDNPIQKFSRSVVPMGKKVKDQTFGFDKIFDENASQGDVYEATTKPLLDSVMDGYNATVFAYGATGCGKTHTITGTPQQPGIIFLTMQELFERLAECANDKVTEISLSYLEIYNETIRDLLVPSTVKGGLMLREDAHQAVSVSGLSSHHPKNVEEVMDMIMRGNELRTMSPTAANATSSRSHAVLQINIAQKDRNASVEEPHTMATLSIIDLAGSERASATKNRGERLLEGANINKSLLSLGSCINALCDPRKRNHVPYRNSKLTRLLKFSLGGNCKTVMIVCVSPSSQHFDETQNTLRYANRAKNIQTKVTRNVYNVNRHVKDFLVKIDEQIQLINELKAQAKDYEAVAFAKFKKQNEKKDGIAREGILRIRAAYEHSAIERSERTNSMIKLRQIGRRIAILSSWIAAFDNICDELDDQDAMRNLRAVRKSAQGILIELESGRHHCQQKISKNNWNRALNTALDTGLRQLKELDASDTFDSETLRREVEFLKANAECEAFAAVAEQDKCGDAAVAQVLLQAHFETIAAIENMNKMSVDEAVEHGTEILRKMLNRASTAVSHVIKPDGSIAPVEAFAPSKTGTPKRRKQSLLVDNSPIRNPVLTAPQIVSSPMRASPRRRVGLLASAKKGVAFSPKKKKTPTKTTKRGVRWRDDEEEGSLTEFAKSPKKFESSPMEETTTEMTLPQISDLSASFMPTHAESPGSSPLPPPPESTLSVQSKNDRFKAGFLSKKSDGSPTIPPPRITNISSSDTEPSPLRELNGSKTNRQSFTPTKQPDVSIMEIDSDGPTSNSASNSDAENNNPSANNKEAMEIGSAVRRSSSARKSIGSRTQRRRSPTAATSGSPTGGSDLFATGHARRMVAPASGRENDWKVGVLSPKSSGVLSVSKTPHAGMMTNGARRTTMSGADNERRGHVRMESSGTSTGVTIGERAAMRLSSATHGPRSSMMPAQKNVWR